MMKECIQQRSEVLEYGPSPGRILVVDDDPAILELNSRILRNSGFAVTTAVDGAEAWELFQRTVFDLLVTDQRMPNLTGVDLIQQLRSSSIHLPVILASGLISVADAERCAHLAIDGLLAKPYLLETLVEVVHEVLAAANQAAHPAHQFASE